MEALAIITVVATSSLTAGTLALRRWEQGKGFLHDRGRDDRAAGRILLARAATVMHQAEYAIDAAVAALDSYGYGMFSEDDPERAEPYFEVEKVGRAFDQVRDEVRIFLGPDHQATHSLEQANTNFLEVFRAMKMIRYAASIDPATLATPMGEDRLDRQMQSAATARDGFKLSQEHFVRRAHAAVGADLPGGED